MGCRPGFGAPVPTDNWALLSIHRRYFQATYDKSAPVHSVLMRTDAPDALPVFRLILLHDTRRFVEVFQLVE